MQAPHPSPHATNQPAVRQEQGRELHPQPGMEAGEHSQHSGGLPFLWPLSNGEFLLPVPLWPDGEKGAEAEAGRELGPSIPTVISQH